jgi:hypothetical protein
MPILNKIRAGAIRAKDGIRRRFAPVWTSPLYQRGASNVRGLFTKRPRRLVLEPYTNLNTLPRRLFSVLFVMFLALFCLIYGFFFSLSVPYIVIPYILPIIVMVFLIIWVLPEFKNAPTAILEYLFPLYMIALYLWPFYLAVALPGLPWFTLTRLTGLPMIIFLLIGLSVSTPLRHQIYLSVTSIKPLWICFCGFTVVEFLTLPISKSPGASLQLVLSAQIDIAVCFLLSALLFRRMDFIEKYWALICVMAVPVSLITILEFNEQHVLWAKYVPNFLRINDPNATRMLMPFFRPGINVYRAKANFGTPLVLAEYLGLLTPLLLYFGGAKIPAPVRIISFLLIPFFFYIIRLTDSRLGVVGMLVSFLMYGMLWTINRWRRHRDDLISATLVFGYPVFFVAAVVAVKVSHTLNALVLGGGAQAASSAARDNQLSSALPKLFAMPFGRGAGQSGMAMGYAKGDFITIDNYFISLSLDYGVLGVIFWYGMFIAAIIVAVRYCTDLEYAHRREAVLLAPLAVELTAFIVVKWVHAQGDLHATQFMMLGMVSALVYRLKTNDKTT